MAFHAEISMNRAVQLNYAAAACGLMQPINILGDDAGKHAALFQFRQGQMGGIGRGFGEKHLFR